MNEDISTAEVLLRIDDEIDEEMRKKLREMYRKDDGEELITGERHRNVTGVALNAVKGIIRNGGTPEDIRMALHHLAICIDAKKYNLSVKQSYIDHRICKLLEKYCMKRP